MMKSKERQVLDCDKTKHALWEGMYFNVDSYKLEQFSLRRLTGS